MAITLVTGQPGHGKTQWAIDQARKLAAEGRRVYAGNIRGLKYEEAGFIELPEFETWQDLPDGSVVLWDECYTAMPQRAAGRAVPAHVEALARHRHRGFDFLLVCQQPKQVDSFVSGLVERHLHVRRKFGTQFVRIKEWDKWERDPDRATPLVTINWKLDPSVWPLYESATQHTMKRRIPWYIWGLPLAILAVVGAWLGVPMLMIDRARSISAEQEETRAAADQVMMTPFALNSVALGAGAGAGVPAVDVDSIRQQSQALRYTDPLAYMRPRLPAMPWTAPAYDDVPLAPPPRIACMSSETSCNCMAFGNQQSVRWMVEDELCRIIAREGIYDPTIQPEPVRRMTYAQPMAESSAVPAGTGRQSARGSASSPYVGTAYVSPDVRASMTR